MKTLLSERLYEQSLKDTDKMFTIITYVVDRQSCMISFVDRKNKALKGKVTHPRLQTSR